MSVSSVDAGDFRCLLCLPPTILRRVLLCVDSAEVESLQQTCTGKFQQQPAPAKAATASSPPSSSPSMNFPHGWSSYLSSIRSFLEDRSSLLRESQLRSTRLQTIGYKQGLDAANDLVDQTGLLQAAFSRGFQSGAHSGWSDAVAKGLLAGMACFLHQSTNTATKESEKELKQEVVALNNAVNAKLLILPLANSTQSAKPSSSTARVSIQVSSESSSSSSCGDNCSCSKSSSTNEVPPANGCCKGSDGGSCACKEQAEEDAPPPLLPVTKVATTPPSTSLADISSADLYLRLNPMAESVGIKKEDFLLHAQLPKPVEPIASNGASVPSSATAALTVSSSVTTTAAGATTESASSRVSSKPAKRAAPAAAKPPSIEDMQMAAMDW